MNPAEPFCAVVGFCPICEGTHLHPARHGYVDSPCNPGAGYHVLLHGFPDP